MLTAVALALVATLAWNGTSVLPQLAEKKGATPAPAPTPTPAPTVLDPDAPVPGSVLTARPQPRRCPSPPCLP